MHQQLAFFLLLTLAFKTYPVLHADAFTSQQENTATEQRSLDDHRQEQKIQNQQLEKQYFENKRIEQQNINRQLEQKRLDNARNQQRDHSLIADLHEEEVEFRNYQYHPDPSTLESNGNPYDSTPYENIPNNNTEGQYQTLPFQQVQNPQYNPYQNPQPTIQQPGCPNGDCNQNLKNLTHKIEQLDRDNHRLEEQNAAALSQQKRTQEQRHKRQLLQAQWEKDHERE